MSTMKEILMLEAQTKGAIRLWPEGIFYKAYFFKTAYATSRLQKFILERCGQRNNPPGRDKRIGMVR